jgi:hypothetical protein
VDHVGKLPPTPRDLSSVPSSLVASISFPVPTYATVLPSGAHATYFSLTPAVVVSRRTLLEGSAIGSHGHARPGRCYCCRNGDTKRERWANVQRHGANLDPRIARGQDEWFSANTTRVAGAPELRLRAPLHDLGEKFFEPTTYRGGSKPAARERSALFTQPPSDLGLFL